MSNNQDITWNDEVTWDKPASSNGTMDAIKQGLTGVALVAGAGYGAKKFAQPFLDKAPLDAKIDMYRKSLKLPENTSPDFVLKAVKANNNRALTNAQGDLTNVIANNLKNWENSAYANYGAGLQKAEGILQAKNIPIEAKDVTGIINDARKFAVSRGVPEEQLMALDRAKESVGLGNMGFIKAKGVIDNIAADDKLPSYITRTLREKWGQYLETVAPIEVKNDLATLNSQYAEFAPVRDKMSRVFNTSIGKADTQKLFDYVKKATNSPIDTGIDQVAKVLGDGNALVPGIPGIKQSVAQVGQLKQAQTKFSEEAPLLLDRLSTLNKQIANRSKIATGTGKAAMALFGLGKITHLFGAYPMISPMLEPPPAPSDLNRAMQPQNIVPNVLGIGNPKELNPA